MHAERLVRVERRAGGLRVFRDEFEIAEGRHHRDGEGDEEGQPDDAADLVGGVNLDVKDPMLARTLLDLSQTATISDSLKLGKAVLNEIGGINRLHKENVEQAGFAVLKAPDIPSILIETAFISNPEEERRLNDDAYQNKMADAIIGGIRKYFAKNPPLAKSKLARLD